VVRRGKAKKRRQKKAVQKPADGAADIPSDMIKRDRIEVALRDSELRYRRLFETAQDGIFLLDAKSGQITDVNPYLISMLGYSHREFLGKKLWEVGPFKDAFRSKKKFLELQKKGYVRYEDLPLETKQGKPMDVEFVSNIYDVGRTKVIQCNIRDITARKRAEEKLKLIEARYSDVFNNSMNSIVVYKSEDNGKHFTIVDFNKAAEKSEKVLKKEVIGKRVSSVFPGIKEFGILDVFRRVWKSGQPEYFPAKVYKDKRIAGWRENYIFKLDTGEIVAIYSDLTKEKRAEESLRIAHKQLVMSQKAAGSGVWVWDIPSGKMTWSPELYKMFGLNPEKDRADMETWGRLLHPDDKKLAFERLRKSVKDHTQLDSEYRVVLPSGTVRWIRALGNTEYDSKGKALINSGICLDVTERKQYLANLKRKNRILSLISECNQAIVRSDEELPLMRKICKILVEIGGYRMAWVGCVEHGEKKRVIPKASYGFERGYLKTVDITWANTKRGQGPTGIAIRSGTPSIMRNIEKNPSYSPWRKNALKRGYSSSIALPILIDGHMCGALNIYSGQPEAFDFEEVRLLEELVQDVAYGLSALRAKKALLESEKTFSVIFNNATDIVVFLDAYGKILKINPSVSRIWGYNPMHIVGKRFDELTQLLPPDSIKMMREKFKKRLLGADVPPYVVKAQTTEGRHVFAEVRGSIVKNGKVNGVVVTLSDITERMYAEKRLQASYEVATLLSSGGSVADTWPAILRAVCTNLDWAWGEIWMLDGERKHLVLADMWHEPSKKFAAFTKITSKIKFSSGSGLPGRVWVSGKPVWVEDLSLDKKFLRTKDALEAGFKSACAFPLTMGKEIVGVILLFSKAERSSDNELLQSLNLLGYQIGEFIRRNSIEESLKFSENRFRSVFERGTVGILLSDPSYHFVRANPSACRIFGYSEKELCSRTFKDITHPDHLKYDIEQMGLLTAGRIQFYRTTKQYVRKDGTVIWGLVNVSTIRDSDGWLRYYLAMVEDITEQKHNEDLLRSQKEQLEELSKTKERFMADMTHELKTPLSVILLNLKLANRLDKTTQRHQYDQCFDLMWRNAMRLSRSIEQIMRLSNLDTVEVHSEPFSINHIMRSVYRDYVPLARSKGIDLQIRGKDIKAEGDPHLLAMAVSNLVSNAIKFTDTGSVRLSWGESGGEIRIVVTDTGVGISDKSYERLFTPFFKENYNAPGSGIGLFITRAMVERMGGSITFKSIKGKGSEFIITVPKGAGE
jgi:two-component system sensor histidine kinase/response regulator